MPSFPRRTTLLHLPPQPFNAEGFNPTMVRLLPVTLNRLQLSVMVSIPQWCDCCISEITGCVFAVPSFNPTMVRLLPQTSVTLNDTLVRFNPTMVRLLRLCRSKSHKNRTVSIPQWCDCCRRAEIEKFKALMFQSHNGAIAAGRMESYKDLIQSFNPTMVRLLPCQFCDFPQDTL